MSKFRVYIPVKMSLRTSEAGDQQNQSLVGLNHHVSYEWQLSWLECEWGMLVARVEPSQVTGNRGKRT